MSMVPHSPATYLAEGLRLYKGANPAFLPIWRKRLPKWMARLDRPLIVELSRDLVLRVRDPKTGQVLAESKPGQLADLAP